MLSKNLLYTLICEKIGLEQSSPIMATVRSLGLHEPSGLSYLLNESIIPTNSSRRDHYNWEVNTVYDFDHTPVEEELLTTKTCVLWSRGGILKRVFRLEQEGESIIQAVVTSFPVNDGGKSHGGLSSTKPGLDDRHQGYSEPLPTQSRKRRKVKDAPACNPFSVSIRRDERIKNDSARALVVVLKTQTHVYFLSGDSLVVHMPFEAESVLPTPRGLIFQRKPDAEIEKAPPVPPNSLLSSQISGSTVQASQSFSMSAGIGNRPPLTISISPAQQPHHGLFPRVGKHSNLPRVFTLTDPMSEMGLVVSIPSSPASQHLNTNEAAVNFEILEPVEEIVYISAKDEWPEDSSAGIDPNPFILVVTLNRQTSVYTIWTAKYRNKDSFLPSKRGKSLGTGASSRRRSSRAFGLGTGATTPVGRGPIGIRESLEAGWGGNNLTVSKNESRGKDNTEDLVSQLGPEFGDVGASMKNNRRVSSLLARADLGTGNDRTTFSELVTGNTGQSGIHGGPRRGASLGPYSSRASLGATASRQRRSSAFGDNSILSNGSSFVDNPVDHLLEELNSGGDFEGFESMGLSETIEGLPRELVLTRVECFSSSRKPSTLPGTKNRMKKPKIFTLVSPFDTSQEVDSLNISICIPEAENSHLILVNLQVQCHQIAKRDFVHTRSRSDSELRTFVPRVVDMRQGPEVIDACKLSDGDISRMLVMTGNADGSCGLTLQAPWSALMKVDFPSKFMVYDSFGVSPIASPGQRRDAGLKRVISDMSKTFGALENSSIDGQLDVVDGKDKRHKIQICMAPKSRHVKRVLDVCDFVLRGANQIGDGMLVGWWNVLKWLTTKSDAEGDLEWTSFVVLLFSLGVDFVENKSTRTPVKQRRKSKLLRSSSSSSVDMESWETMLDQEAGAGGTSSDWMVTNGWKWSLEQEGVLPMSQLSPGPKHRKTRSNSTTNVKVPTTGRKNTYLLRCISLSREFLNSSAGREASGTQGYLPGVIGKDSQSRQTSLGALLIGLHLYREEEKLDVNASEGYRADLGMLAPILGQIGGWLGWSSWGWKERGYYGLETADMDQWMFEDSKMSSIPVPAEPFVPPSIFHFVENHLQQSREAHFLTILDLASNLSGSDRRPKLGSRLWKQMAALTPRTVALTGYLSQAASLTSTTDKVEAMLAWGLTTDIVQSLPDGVSVPLYESIAGCQADPPSSWNASLLDLIDRDDLGMSMRESGVHPALPRSHIAAVHDAFRDFHSIGYSTLESESMTAFDASAEADRSSVTKLIFKEDRRFVEASKLVNQMRPPIAECPPEPDWTETELLEAQKVLVQIVAVRTMAVSSGRGMIHYSARVPLLTEKLPIAGFTAQCIMKPSNVTFSAERGSFSEDKVCWAYFHAGASTGLAISKAAKGIDTSWVLYNRPAELTNRHAGFLLALGLNGHLKTLAKWVAFKYLTPKHTMTSIGLLLGLSASYMGTMDTLITRLLSVHVTRMLPQGAAELNLSPLTQTTGIMGIGLLYCNSQHRRMSEVMLSELENVDQEELTPPQETLRDEGYRLAAGFALGLINLGKGNDLRGLHDMHLVERLLALAIGAKNVNIVHILDRASAGAVVAIAIIFMKTHDSALAAKIDIPDTIHQFDYVRPDVFLLRTVARHLIMWDHVQASFEWLEKCLPKAYRKRARLDTVRQLSSEDMPFFNIVSGLCFSIGLRFAGSGSAQVRDLLIYYLDQFIRICKLPAMNYDGKLTRNSVRNCQDAVALSAASVMAGTGDLEVFRRLRSLHGRFDADTPYGSHLATHMAIGALFLGGGTYTFGTSNIAIASLLCAFYPVFPTTVLDNKSHLQAFRHLWVIAAEPRCLIPRDVDSHRPVSIPITLTLRDGTSRSTSAPVLLPDLTSISTIKITSPDHWPLTIDFASNPTHLPSFQQNQSIYVRRRAAYDIPGSSVFHSTLQALTDAASVPNNTSMNSSFLVPWNLSAAKLPIDWIYKLPSLCGLDMAEQALVLPPHSTMSHASGARFLRGTVVDTRLMLEKACADEGIGSGVRDRLWQLRLLFAWVDGMEEEGENEEGEKKKGGMWLRREVVEDLRWRAWCLGGGGGE
jgi:anaphase-promoting complex subunit 1